MGNIDLKSLKHENLNPKYMLLQKFLQVLFLFFFLFVASAPSCYLSYKICSISPPGFCISLWFRRTGHTTLFYVLALTHSATLYQVPSPDHTIKIVFTWPPGHASTVQDSLPFTATLRLMGTTQQHILQMKAHQDVPQVQLSLPLDPHFFSHWIFPTLYASTCEAWHIVHEN